VLKVGSSSMAVGKGDSWWVDAEKLMDRFEFLDMLYL